MVATNIPGSGVQWLNRHGVTGLNVAVGDAQALAAALAELLSDPERRAQMGREGRRRYRSEFTSEAATHRFMNLYRALAGRPVTGATA